MIKSINIRAIAKINLGLNVLNKREDGFHNLSTLFYPIYDLYDLITIKHSDRFLFESNITSFSDDDNLIVKAVKFMEKITSKKFNVSIKLEKNLPIGAGLGGGSSDCASIIASLNDMFNLGFNYKELIDIALKLGSDVPFFIKPYPAIGTSRGELLKKIELEIRNPILIVNPGIHISTKDAFNSLSNYKDRKLTDYNKVIKSDIKEWKHLIYNDFENYVFDKYEKIKDIKEELYSAGVEFALMSGTGSTVYGIFKDSNSAESAKKRFPESYFTFISEI